MKTTHRKQIREFLKKTSAKIKFPFLQKISKPTQLIEVIEKTINVLPELLRPDAKNDNKSKFDLEIKPKTEIPSWVLPKQILTSNQTAINIPNAQKKDLLKLVESKKIQNKLEKYEDQKVIKIPAYQFGKNITSAFKFGVNSLSQSVKTAVPNLYSGAKSVLESKNLNFFGTARQNTQKTDPIDIKKTDTSLPNKEVNAILQPNAKTAGGSEGSKIAVIAERNPAAPKEAALVGESGKELIEPKNGLVLPLPNPSIESKQTEVNQPITASVPEEQKSILNMATGLQKQNSPSKSVKSPIPSAGSVGGLGSPVSSAGSVGSLGSPTSSIGAVGGLGSPTSSIGAVGEVGEEVTTSTVGKIAGAATGAMSALGTIGAIGGIGAALPLLGGIGGIAALGGLGLAAASMSRSDTSNTNQQNSSQTQQQTPQMMVSNSSPSILNTKGSQKKKDTKSKEDERPPYLPPELPVYRGTNYDPYKKTANDSFISPEHRQKIG
jgi:hypothetical protein